MTKNHHVCHLPQSDLEKPQEHLFIMQGASELEAHRVPALCILITSVSLELSPNKFNNCLFQR